jgi:hypothetical protein
MRQVGMAAFQTTLLPHLSPAEVRRLNHTPLAGLRALALPVVDEVARVFTIIEPVVTDTAGRIHFAGDVLDVLLNLRRWQRELVDPPTRERWGRRAVTYFVTEPRFDGHRARLHLTRHLAFVKQPLADLPSLQPVFERWLTAHKDVITLHPRGPIVLLPPVAFTVISNVIVEKKITRIWL